MFVCSFVVLSSSFHLYAMNDAVYIDLQQITHVSSPQPFPSHTTQEEIHQIVTRRRSSEYLLQKLSVTRSDYLRYIEAEILLEKLRKLRKQKVLQEWRQKMRNDAAELNDEMNPGNARSKKGGKKQKKQHQHAYQTSGPGDAHILSNIHFLYQRLLKKFHYPLDVILNYAEFAKEHKSFNVMSRVYAEGLQRHPREEGLWIQVCFFFG
jgi:hypothetical protein